MKNKKKGGDIAFIDEKRDKKTTNNLKGGVYV